MSRRSRYGMSTYSFALEPEEHQPSGSWNRSRIDNVDLVLHMDPRYFVQRRWKRLFGYMVINHRIALATSFMRTVGRTTLFHDELITVVYGADN